MQFYETLLNNVLCEEQNAENAIGYYCVKCLWSFSIFSHTTDFNNISANDS